MNAASRGFARQAAALVFLALSGPAAAAVIAESESNDTAATATSADPAAADCLIVAGTISSATDNDFYSIPLVLGERVWVATDTGATQGAGATSRDTVIDLIDTDGSTVIETDDDDGTGNGGDGSIETEATSVIAGRAAPVAGTYYLRVQGKGGGTVNPYKLVVVTTTAADQGETESNDDIGSSDSPVNPPCGGPHSGAIATSGDVDISYIDLIAGQLLFVAVDAGTGWDPRVQLISTAGTTLLTANSSGAGTVGNPAGESFTYFVPSDGMYYVRIASADGSVGDYRALVGRSFETAFADLSVAVAASADPVVANSAFTYTITASNLSQVIDASSVDITLAISGGGSVVSASGTDWTCTTGPVECSSVPATLTKNSSANPIVVAMTAPVAAGSLDATATVSGSQPDDAPLNDSATEATQVTAPPSGGGGGGGAVDLSLLLLALASRGRRRLGSRGAPPG